MAKKEFHHYQFFDPFSGEMPLSVTLMINYHRSELAKSEKTPLSLNDLIDLNELLDINQDNVLELMPASSKSKNKKK